MDQSSDQQEKRKNVRRRLQFDEDVDDEFKVGANEKEEREQVWSARNAVIWSPKTVGDDEDVESDEERDEVEEESSKLEPLRKRQRHVVDMSLSPCNVARYLCSFVDECNFRGVAFVVSLIHEDLLDCPERRKYDTLLLRCVERGDWKTLAILVTLKSHYSDVPTFNICNAAAEISEKLEDDCSASDMAERTICSALVAQDESTLSKESMIASLRTIAENGGYGYLGRVLKPSGQSGSRSCSGVVTAYRSESLPARYEAKYSKKSRFFFQAEEGCAHVLLSTKEVQGLLEESDKHKYQTPRPYDTSTHLISSATQDSAPGCFTIDSLIQACKTDDVVTIAIACMTGLDVGRLDTGIEFPNSNDRQRRAPMCVDELEGESDYSPFLKFPTPDSKSSAGTLNLARFCVLIGAFGCGFLLRSLLVGHLHSVGMCVGSEHDETISATLAC